MATFGRSGGRRALHADPARQRPVAGRDGPRLGGRRPGADRVPRPGRRGGAQYRRAHVRDLRGFEQRTLVLERDSKGGWSVDGTSVRGLKGATDVDLGCSPSTNTLPIRRLRLGVGATKTIKAAWVRFPELTVVKADQKYTRLDEFTYRYCERRLRGRAHGRRRGPRRRLRGMGADGRRDRPRRHRAAGRPALRGQDEGSRVESLQDQVVVITGASAGIGRATARDTARCGRTRLCSAPDGGSASTELEAEFPDRVAAVTMDVGSPADSQRLVEPPSSASAASIRSWRTRDRDVRRDPRQLRRGAVRDARHEHRGDGVADPCRRPAHDRCRSWRHRDRGVVADFGAVPTRRFYAATKFAQVGLAGSLDRELREKGHPRHDHRPAGTSTEFAIGAGGPRTCPSCRRTCARRISHSRSGRCSSNRAACARRILDDLEHGQGWSTSNASSPGTGWARRVGAVVALIVANLIPLIGVLFFGWSVWNILIVYWLENGIVGASTS